MLLWGSWMFPQAFSLQMEHSFSKEWHGVLGGLGGGRC